MQTLGYLAAFLAPLLGNLVAYRPHHDRRVVAVVQHKVGDVFLCPLLEESGVAVLALRIYPHVETLCHHHHSQRVAQFHLPCGGHVVGGADSVTPHVFQYFYLSCKGIAVNGGTQRAEVVMQAYAFQFSCNAVQLESMFLADADVTYSELPFLIVQRSKSGHAASSRPRHCVVLRLHRGNADACAIERWALWRPQHRVIHAEVGANLAVGRHVDVLPSHEIALRVFKIHGHLHAFHSIFGAERNVHQRPLTVY